MAAASSELAVVSRRVRPGTYAFFLLACAALVFITHAGFFDFPYYWDEIGFYIPSALDVYQQGSLIPHSTTPNAHPPGLRLWLAGAWTLLGPSIAVTRGAMLLLATFGMLLTFMLAIELGGRLPGAPAFGAVVLLASSPLFFMQASLAQPELPAMVAGLAALLCFLRQRWAWSVVACVVLVLFKETGIVFPLVFAVFAWRDGRRPVAAAFLLPGFVLAAWFALLLVRTGHLFGDAAFSDYNLVYNLHPARFTIALVRRLYTLFVENFHWLGTIAILNFWWKRRWFLSSPWPLIGTLVAAHVLLVSALGGAILERYLVPVLPFFYIAVAAGWSVFSSRARWMHQAAMTGGLMLGLWWNPPYPFPFENSLAARDQVMLFQQAAGVADALRGDPIFATAWPLSAALKDPRMGYVSRRHDVREVPDFQPGSVQSRGIRPFEFFILYTREWDPPLNWMRLNFIRNAWRQIYGYRPQMTPDECSRWLGVPAVVTYEQRGQRLDIYRVNTQID